MKFSKTVKRPKNFPTPARTALTLITFALVAAIGFSSCNSTDNSKTIATPPSPAKVKGGPVIVRQAPPNNPPASSVVGVAVPDGILNKPLTTLTGKSLKLSDYAGKVVVLNLWATWCGPCRIETPELVKLSNEYKGKGVEVIGLTTKENDPDIAAIKNFVKEQNVDYNVVYAEGAFIAPLVEGQNVIPQSFVISPDGRLLRHFAGFSETQTAMPNVTTPARLRAAIDEAMNGKG
jgi:thiol-disulfide isomerase/thioredoxin